MNRRLLFFLLLLPLAWYSCQRVPVASDVVEFTKTIPFPGYEFLSQQDREKADSILQVALDHEALYTLMGDVKPMSSIGYSLSFPLAKDSTKDDGDHEIVPVAVDSIASDLDELESWNRVLSALSFEQYRFLLIPFRNVWKGDRNFQILVCRQDLLDSLLNSHDSFFGQWGFVPGTDPSILITTTEFESKHDRYRAYGYLFGYPDHAVDFFVEASREQERTGEFVTRQFFQVPVHARESGHFTWALPEDMEPLSSDSARYYQAVDVLETYQNMRPDYIKADSSINAVKLYRDWWKSTH